MGASSGHGQLILVDIDVPAAADGSPLVNAMRWLADRAAAAGAPLDLSATVSVSTPGHPASGHRPGWHLWYRADPARPVHLGPLGRCHVIELRTRGTCPGSPGYPVRSHPGELPALPPWLAGLADIAQGEDPGPWARAGATWAVTDFGAQPTQAQVREVIDKGPG